MRSTFAPSVAGLYVFDFETKYIFSNTNPFGSYVSFWRRYIDDILIVWQGPGNILMDFINWLNTLDNNLRITHTLDPRSIVFLDVTISKENGGLETKTYQKTHLQEQSVEI